MRPPDPELFREVFEQVETVIRGPLGESDVEAAFRVLLAMLEGVQRDRGH